MDIFVEFKSQFPMLQRAIARMGNLTEQRIMECAKEAFYGALEGYDDEMALRLFHFVADFLPLTEDTAEAMRFFKSILREDVEKKHFPKTIAAIFEYVAERWGMRDKAEADELFKFLLTYAPTDVIRAGTPGHFPVERLLHHLANASDGGYVETHTEERLRVLALARVRNTRFKFLVREAPVLRALHGCSREAYQLVASYAEKVAARDRAKRALQKILDATHPQCGSAFFSHCPAVITVRGDEEDLLLLHVEAEDNHFANSDPATWEAHCKKLVQALQEYHSGEYGMYRLGWRYSVERANEVKCKREGEIK